MFLYVTNNTVKLSLEDSLAIQRLYGIKKPNVVPSTRSPPVTTNTTKTTSNKRDLCDLQYVDNVLVLNHRIFVTYRNTMWMIDVNGKRYKGPIALNDYLRFLPANVKRLKLPTNMHVNAALVTNRGQTYVIFNDDSVALLNECDMTVNGYHTLQSIFPGIPPSPTLAFRYIDGSLYFLHRLVRILERRYPLILPLLQYEETKGKRTPPPMYIGDVTLRFGRINSIPMLRLDSSSSKVTTYPKAPFSICSISNIASIVLFPRSTL
ncbi:hypothetical protein ALC62_00592 [Cyphomyrmex costatus]|uniref:Matrix metalloproteinase-14 n=1 Tax=Cyphomyrmex costatus TaxID=456900 RepID=A0A151IQJ9_9HYME|nr:hypothetical protein ALC62_00592 [Cyphomyrmex costatus]